MSKIIQIVTQMEAGGAQRVALWIAEGLTAKGHDVEVWYLYKKRSICHEGIKTVILFDGKPCKISDILKLLTKLLFNLLKAKPDAIITHTHYANIICQMMAWILKKPKRIAVQHNPISTYPLLPRYLDPVFGYLGIYTQIVAVSKCVADSLSDVHNKYKKRMSIIYNGVPASEYRDRNKYATKRERLGLPETSFLILNVGRLSPQKNHEFLLNLLKLLPNHYLAIVGEGELHKNLVAKSHELCVSERVIFTGEVPYSVVSDYYYVADVFAFPSKYESFGLALVEAMRAGLTVVASDIPAAHEIIGTSGYILPLMLEEWVSIMKELEEKQKLREKMGERAKIQSDRYTISTMVKAYEKLL